MLNPSKTLVTDPPADAYDWWRSAVIYQVYIRSFADGDGDGIGDLAGLRARLPYLAQLGIDALWINPWYPSPMADAGYDVSDYRDIEPVFGAMDEARALIDEAHALNLRIILDIVPNHTSAEHPWFQEALAAEPGSPARERFHFREGKGAGGELPPNDWHAVFGGPAWHRVPDGQWYLHLFAPEQPDLNWENPEVRDEFDDILRFWFDLGIDGFRIDVAHGMVKDPEMPDLGRGEFASEDLDSPVRERHPHWDGDGLHEIFRRWRAIADSYPEPKIFVAEAVVPVHRHSDYLRPDELHTAFNFNFLKGPLEPGPLRSVIDSTSAAMATVDAPATWVLGNHDQARPVTRYGREYTGVRGPKLDQGLPTDLELGTRRARAAALLMLALPGGAYIYQGEELGLWEVEDLPESVLQDPTWERSGHTVRGRDGCRVPLPWSGVHPPFGFSPEEADPWLPQPKEWDLLTVDAQTGEPESMLELYREALRLRRELPTLGDGPMAWLDTPPDVLAFTRGPVICAFNLSTALWQLPADTTVLLASNPLDGHKLPPNTAVWITQNQG
ncbi:glycoside hydrolase family 13 protein [Streptomyces chiangmaiensis]|uniref:Glycoside hydrolase family 13 protein n=1 Tax=Streptomyces chiangmaiensis TaxID=766497 RepID=A0ABU7FMJ4_9ACTN|nr:glycoside hydrolase family 13 protein [Streptomyces chiangmaiensis]MED7825169.1 glycoside hydrolase family 13 protein [Streptomyces chiangmaiensis]